MTTTAVYRQLVRLYPRRFRDEFADDLTRTFEDLVIDHGTAGAWRRTIVDLTVTLPRYRLETVMSARNSTFVIWILALGAALAGTFMVDTSGVMSVVAALIIVAACLFAVAQRGKLARSLRADDPIERRQLWKRAGIAALVAVAVIAIAMVDLADEESWPAVRVLLYNAVFFVAVAVALASSVVALRRPHHA